MIILNISVKGSVIRGRRLIKGQLLFEEIRYIGFKINSETQGVETCNSRSILLMDEFFLS